MLWTFAEAHRASGTWGTVSWKIGNKRVIVMWSNPFDHISYYSYLAVGIMDNSKQHTSASTNDMYYEDDVFTYFKRQRYSASSARTPVIWCSHTFCIQGIMGPEKRSIVNIAVFPKAYRNLAPGVKRKIRMKAYQRKVDSRA